MIGTVDLETGKFSKKIELDRSKYFGEGIVFFKDKLYQLTYKNQLGFIYDATTFQHIRTFGYPNKEGWGMTRDTSYIIMSDGSDALTYFNPETMSPVKQLNVTENGTPCDNLNELEWIKGYIYSNIWRKNYIVKIDPSNGQVVGRIDLSSLAFEAEHRNPEADVMNGIAYDELNDKIYVTGKLWANIYRIEFTH